MFDLDDSWVPSHLLNRECGKLETDLKPDEGRKPGDIAFKDGGLKSLPEPDALRAGEGANLKAES